MEKLLEEALLYDFYGEMLTSHQKEIYEDFILNDYSLGEIAGDREISRQAVYDIVKRCRKQLQSYESKLHLIEKFMNTRKQVSQIHACAHEILAHEDDKELTGKMIRQIEELSNTIVEEF